MPVSFSQYEDKINQSDNILVVYGDQAELPAVATATSIYLWLKTLDKKVSLVANNQPVVAFSSLVGINKVKTRLPQENLVITFPYNSATIDKVVSDLNEEKQELSLIVKPQKGQIPLKPEDLKISYQVADFDLIILVDVRSQKELQRLDKYGQNTWQASEKLIALNTFANPLPVTAAISEALGKSTGFANFWGNFLRDNQIKVEADLASNLLLGLETETKNFSMNCPAEVFELAAWLLRQGATRHHVDEQIRQSFEPEHHLPRVNFKPKTTKQPRS